MKTDYSEEDEHFFIAIQTTKTKNPEVFWPADHFLAINK